MALDIAGFLANAYSLDYFFQNGSEGFYFIVAAFSIIALLAIKAENKLPLFLALALSITLVPAIKSAIDAPRPCEGLPDCPSDAGFPSGHSSIAAIFAIASLGTLSFYFFFPAGIAIAVSRATSNVHSWDQVAGGIATGLVLFFASKAIIDSAVKLAAKHGWLPKKRSVLTAWQKKRAGTKKKKKGKK